MTLYVDGLRVGQRTRRHHRPGLQRLLADRRRQPRRLANQPSSNYFDGTIDEVAIYPTALTAAQVVDHYVASRPHRRRSRRPRPTPTARRSTTTSPTCTGGSTRPAARSPPTPAPAMNNRHLRRRRHLGRSRRAHRAPANTAATLQRQRPASSPATPQVHQPDDLHRGGVVQDHHHHRRQDHRLRQHARPAPSSSYDRHVYMQNDGKLAFGIWTGSDQHHHLADRATTTASGTTWSPPRAPTGMKLYVDGAAGRHQRRRPTPRTTPATGGSAATTTWGSQQPVLRRHHRRGRGLPHRADRAARSPTHFTRSAGGRCRTRHPTAAFTSSADRPDRDVRRVGPRPTPTARSPPTPGTSVTATTGTGADRDAHLRRGRHLHGDAHGDRQPRRDQHAVTRRSRSPRRRRTSCRSPRFTVTRTEPGAARSTPARRPTPTARSRPTPGTSVTARPAPGPTATHTYARRRHLHGHADRHRQRRRQHDR